MVEVRVPGSKSMTARALFLAAAGSGRTSLIRPLRSDDTEAFAEGLRQLGYQVDTSHEDVWSVEGSPSGPPADDARVFCRDGATTARFLPALAATGHGTFQFDASAQMRRRPMAPLTRALEELGVDLEFTGAQHHHPFVVTARGITGGVVNLDAGASSQFLTALLLLAPLTREGLTINVSALVSEPYVGMTLAMMRSFGVETTVNATTYHVLPQAYGASTYTVEPDASSASYFFAAAALLGGEVTIPDLGRASLQGDLGFVDVLERMGSTVNATATTTTVAGRVLRGGIVNMRDISDTMPTLAAIAPFAEEPTRIVDVHNTRMKECDRLEACAENLRRMGIRAETGPDWIEIHPGTPRPAVIACHGDHRIAMAFSVAALRINGGLTLDDPTCVRKTFPTFHATFGECARRLSSSTRQERG